VLKQSSLIRILFLLLLLLILGGANLPSYLQGIKPWKEPPPVPGLKALQALQGNGIQVPGWETANQVTIEPGGKKWLLHELRQDNQVALLLLRAQRGSTEQPQVEWMDINGYWRWKSDSETRLTFTVEIPAPNTQGDPRFLEETGDLKTGDLKAETGDLKPQLALVEARYFRGVTRQQTYAIMQWYAFPDGGHPKASRWFWRDRLYQISGKREPWVAVCIIMPIEPLGDIEQSRPLIESLAKTVQATLMAEAFNNLSAQMLPP
jgi:cyanoexosortase B-associated protein